MKPNLTSIAHYLFIFLFTCCGALPTLADDKAASPFVGEWCNKDFETRGVTRVHIRQEGTKLIAHMWGRCHPTECDWGDATAALEDGGNVLSLTWKTDYNTVTQKLKLLADGSLELVGHTDFTEKEGREDYDSKNTFAQGLAHDWSDSPKN